MARSPLVSIAPSVNSKTTPASRATMTAAMITPSPREWTKVDLSATTFPVQLVSNPRTRNPAASPNKGTSNHLASRTLLSMRSSQQQAAHERTTYAFVPSRHCINMHLTTCGSLAPGVERHRRKQHAQARLRRHQLLGTRNDVREWLLESHHADTRIPFARNRSRPELTGRWTVKWLARDAPSTALQFS